MNTLLHRYSQKIYRQDMQGVRAVGAMLIMVFHIWFNKVSGGVDVFFVVSGFFMANMLLYQAATEGQIRPWLFWGKICRRIAPSAYTVLMVTLILAYLFIPATRWNALIDEFVASALHIQNFQLIHTSVDYLARQEPPSAVQQFWALSIQVQFYVALPFVLMVGLIAVKRCRALYPLWVGLGVIILLSFLYGLRSTANTPEAAYFHPLARAWEFFVGVAIAAILPFIRLGSLTRNFLGLLGLFLLLAVALFPLNAKFPGWVAWVPVSAASLLLIAGAGTNTSVSARLLSHRYLTYLGGLAFCIYLWHWPLLVLYFEYFGNHGPSVGGGMLIIAAAIALAIGTKKFIEDPVRRAGNGKVETRLAYIIGAMFFLPAVAASGAVKYHFQSLVHNDADGKDIFPEGFFEEQIDASEVSYGEFIAAKSVLPESYTEACHQRTAEPEVIICAYGDVDAQRTIALVGGSHATQWLPALDIIGQRLSIKVLNITKSHCPFGALADAHPSCVDWNERVITQLDALRPELVITNSTRASDGGTAEHVPQAYIQQWRLLEERGLAVVGIRDNPRFDYDAAHCLARNKLEPLVCSKSKTEALAEIDPALVIQQQLTNLQLVDLTDYLCTSDRCTTVFNNTLIYRDQEHLNVAYVEALTDRLQQSLAVVVPHLFTWELKPDG